MYCAMNEEKVCFSLSFVSLQDAVKICMDTDEKVFFLQLVTIYMEKLNEGLMKVGV